MSKIVNKKYNNRWYTDDGLFMFDFQAYQYIGTNLPDVQLKLYYTMKRSPTYAFLWEIINMPYDIDIRLPKQTTIDGFYIEGILKCSIETNIEDGTSNLVIWGDLIEGRGKYDKKEFFVGPMFVTNLPLSSIIPPPPANTLTDPEIPTSLENPKITTPNTVITPTNYQDLFPYMYMDIWPEPSETEIDLNFVAYSPLNTAPPSDNFYEKLVSLHDAEDRVGMLQEAKNFIDGIPPYEGLFIRNVHDLKGAIQYFSSILYTIQQNDDYDLIVQTVCQSTGLTVEELQVYIESQAFKITLQRVWQSYFALIIRLGYLYQVLGDLTRVLILSKTLITIMEQPTERKDTIISNISAPKDATTEETDKNTNEEEEEKEEEEKTNSPNPPFNTLPFEENKQLANATILLPETIFPLPKFNTSTPAIEDKSWVEPYAIGNLQLVRQRLVHYEPGEIAKIHNVMPGEKKEMVTRNLAQTSEERNESNKHEDLYSTHTLESQDSIVKAASETLAAITHTYTYDNVTTNYGPPTNLTINGNWNVKRTNDTPDMTTKNITDFAKKILNQTTQKISDSVTKSRSLKTNKEIEHQTTSTFDNSTNTQAVIGVYRWLNKVYSAQVVNYGNRMIFSFLLDNPAKRFIKQTLEQAGYNLEPPKTLEENNINTFQDITRENYAALCATYNVSSIVLPPTASKIVSQTLEGAESKLVNIPNGYMAENAFATIVFPSDLGISAVNFIISRQLYSFTGEGEESFTLFKEDETVPISANYAFEMQAPPQTPSGFSLTVEIECSCKSETLDNWKIKIYNALVVGYEKQKTAYYNQFNPTSPTSTHNNPMINRNKIRGELRRLCIRELLELAISLNNLPENLEDQPPAYIVNTPRYLQFLEAAFEWNEMTYSFLEDYYETILDKVYSSIFPENDHYLTDFLQAAQARVLLPIKPAFNHSLLFYNASGLIWTGEDELVPAYHTQLSEVLELKKAFQRSVEFEKILDSWEIIVPTSLQVLQQDITNKTQRFC